MFNAIVTQSDEYRNFGFESLTSDERKEYDAWAEQANAGTRDLEPQDLAVRVYDDLDIWEIPGYGRVYFRERDDCWAHNGPRPTNIGLDNRYHATREGAMKALIEAVHLAQDDEAAWVWINDVRRGEEGIDSESEAEVFKRPNGHS